MVNIFLKKAEKHYYNNITKPIHCRLCEIWTNFADYSHSVFGLACDNYPTLPSYAYDACLLLTKVELDLISGRLNLLLTNNINNQFVLFLDRKMYDFVQAAKRGGLAMAIRRLVTSTRGKEVFKEEFEKYFGKTDDNDLQIDDQDDQCMLSKEKLQEYILYLGERKCQTW